MHGKFFSSETSLKKFLGQHFNFFYETHALTVCGYFYNILLSLKILFLFIHWCHHTAVPSILLFDTCIVYSVTLEYPHSDHYWHNFHTKRNVHDVRETRSMRRWKKKQELSGVFIIMKYIRKIKTINISDQWSSKTWEWEELQVVYL